MGGDPWKALGGHTEVVLWPNPRPPFVKTTGNQLTTRPSWACERTRVTIENEKDGVTHVTEWQRAGHDGKSSLKLNSQRAI